MSSANTTPEVQTLPAAVTIAKSIVQQDGLYVIGSVRCPAAGVDEAYLVLDMRAGQIALSAACGCRVGVSLSTLLLNLGAGLAKGHDGAGNQVH